MKRREPFWVHIVLITASFFICFPLLFALIKSTQELSVVTTSSLIPGKEFLNNFKIVWKDYDLGRYIRNSFWISLWVASGKIILSLLASHALVFHRFRGKRIIFAFIVVTLMFPTEILILGLFEIVSNQMAPDLIHLLEWMFNPMEFFFAPTKYGFGWGDSTIGIIVPFLASATGVFLFRQHFLSIPKSLADSARIDGANSFQFLRYVIIPMSRNTIGALALIQFVYVWDQYIWPRIIIRRSINQVVQVGLNMIIANGESVEWGQVMSATIVAVIPPLLVFALLYKSFMNGYGLSSDK